MTKTAFLFFMAVPAFAQPGFGSMPAIGQEVAIPRHLQDGEEYKLSPPDLVELGKALFVANWTSQEGGGRPYVKGTATGPHLSDSTAPLIFPRNFNRISAPDANSCAGCHNRPAIGGGGDIVANVFVLGQRFDFITFDRLDAIPTKGSVDERGLPTTLQTIANSRKTISMFGSGFIEMLARQITADLQAIRDQTPLGGTKTLVSKGISFGTISRRSDGTWDTSGVTGLPAPALATTGSTPPDLIIRPFSQAANVISLRQFTNNAYNQHHGMQSEERFGLGIDEDGDGFVNELTRADITAATIFQATLPVPARVIPPNPAIVQAVANGEKKFGEIGCATCHIPTLPLDKGGWIYTEPNPYNPAGNLRPGDAPVLSIDLTSDQLPAPRLKAKNGVVVVPAYTDFKLHDITSGPGDPNREALDMNQAAGSPGFFAGNSKFITRKLWGIANQHSFGHHGQYTTMRDAVLAHSGEALSSRQAFQTLSDYDRNSVIEFLKSLQILTDGTRNSIEMPDER